MCEFFKDAEIVLGSIVRVVYDMDVFENNRAERDVDFLFVFFMRT